MRGGDRFTLYRSAAIAAAANTANNNLSLIAAGVAFYSMLSIFPALAALISLLSLVADPAVVIHQLEEVREIVPVDVYDILYAQITGLISTSGDRLGWAGTVSVLVALWSARAGVGAMIQGLNVAYNRKGRSTVRHFIRALALTAALVSVGIVALLAVVILPVVLRFLALGALTAVLVDLLRWTVAIAVIFVGIGLLFRYGPNRRPRRTRIVTPGSFLAALSWALLSFLFSYYVSHFATYNQVYGSIGAVIAMLVWLWISSFLVLFGAAFNAEIEAQAPDIVTDTDLPEEPATSS